MEIFSFLPLIVIIILMSALSSVVQKKKVAEAAKKAAPPAVPVPAAPAEPAPVSDLAAAERRAPEQPLVREPAPPQMGIEGADDCHEYMLPRKKTAPARQPEPEEEENPAAQELRRGVILSEVLGRRRPGRRL